MRYEELCQILGKRFPELAPQISHYFDTWGSECLPHLLYHEVLNPYVMELLQGTSNNESLGKVFQFYEELATSEDEEARNLLQVTLLEILWDEKKLLKRVCAYMLPETKKVNEAIREYISYPK